MKRAFNTETLEVLVKMQDILGPVLDGPLERLDLMNAVNEYKRRQREAQALEDARQKLVDAGYKVEHKNAD